MSTGNYTFTWPIDSTVDVNRQLIDLEHQHKRLIEQYKVLEMQLKQSRESLAKSQFELGLAHGKLALYPVKMNEWLKRVETDLLLHGIELPPDFPGDNV